MPLAIQNDSRNEATFELPREREREKQRDLGRESTASILYILLKYVEVGVWAVWGDHFRCKEKVFMSHQRCEIIL